MCKMKPRSSDQILVVTYVWSIRLLISLYWNQTAAVRYDNNNNNNNK